MEYEAVIGLEVHVQIKPKSKLFSKCAYRFGEAPNTLTDKVILGLPGRYRESIGKLFSEPERVEYFSSATLPRPPSGTGKIIVIQAVQKLSNLPKYGSYLPKSACGN
jgi:hypothetical protein